jgi:hypothetical protein
VEYPTVGVRLQPRPLGLAFTEHYGLATVEEVFSYDRLVLALVELSLIPYKTVIDGVLEHILVIAY